MPGAPMLVFGAAGQLGRCLLDAAAATGRSAVGLTRGEVDVTNAAAVRRAVAENAPAVVINVAAYTAVDRAESEREAAFAVNRDGAANVARACAEAGVALLHVSTDYIFDGRLDRPYREDDAPAPESVYGASKLAGAEAVRALGSRSTIIVRTAWVFSANGNNFVRTIWRLAAERETLRVVADQRGSPTPADDLARDLLTMADALAADSSVAGTYHWAGAPPATWFDVATAVVEEARRHGPVAAKTVEPITTAEYPTAARRPANSVLDTTRAERAFGLEPPDWRAGVARAVDQLAAGVGRMAGPP